MPLDQTTLERQLETAETEMAVWVKVLQTNGIAAGTYRRNPKWRQLNSVRKQIRTRMKAVAGRVAVEEDLQARRERKTAGETEEAKSSKEDKSKKDKSKKKKPSKKQKQ